MKKLYLVSGLFFSLLSSTLFGMEQAGKDSVVITIEEPKGKEVATVADHAVLSTPETVEKKNWWKRLSKNKKIVIGLSAITAICGGFDAYRCTAMGCPMSNVSSWLISSMVGGPAGFAALRITGTCSGRKKTTAATLFWFGLGAACWASDFYLETLGCCGMTYFAGNLFNMVKR